MKPVWLLAILYIILIVCAGMIIITLFSFLHKPFLSTQARITDKQVTTFLYTGNGAYLSRFTLAEKGHLGDVRQLLILAAYIAIIAVVLLLFSWHWLTFQERQSILLSPVLFLFYILPPVLLHQFSRGFLLFHQILFPQGNYMFPFDSLLITTYPEKFFLHMGIFLFCLVLLETIIVFLVFIKKRIRSKKRIKTN